MKSAAAALAALVITLAAATASAPAASCGLEGGTGDSFGTAHPGSLEVAFAVHDAMLAGLVEPDPTLPPAWAHLRGDGRLRMLTAALPMTDAAAPISVLLIERGTWTRLTPKAGTWVATTLADRPDASEFTLMASELAVRDLIGGRLTAKDAMARGLLVVTGQASLVAALNQAYPSQRDLPAGAQERARQADDQVALTQ